MIAMTSSAIPMVVGMSKLIACLLSNSQWWRGFCTARAVVLSKARLGLFLWD
jgi:hypothetical protein